jgi:hypothetical protein
MIFLHLVSMIVFACLGSLLEKEKFPGCELISLHSAVRFGSPFGISYSMFVFRSVSL